MFLSTKKVILIVFDFMVCMFSATVVYFCISYSGLFEISSYSLWLAIITLPICIIMGMSTVRAYDIMLRYATVRDYIKCMAAIMIGAVAYMIGDFAIGFSKVTLYKETCFIMSAVIMMSIRMFYYYITTGKTKKSIIKDKHRTLIVGAGQACKIIIEEMKTTCYSPVVIVDDNKQKYGRDICNIKVKGTTSEIADICKKYKIKTILFAIPSCEKERRMEILDICAETGCEVKILPFVRDIVGKSNLLFQAKKISVEDLLGRDPIVFDSVEFKKFIENKVFMVTGGGGSIGSELCRQIAKNKPSKLIILDIYENNAYNIQQELKRIYKDKLDLNVEIASVRDKDKMESVFRKYTPDIVFHAAAHKHVPLMEDNPEEAVKNNVFGTYNCARLAGKFGVEKFVLISTDKAVNPTNVMGATKRMCEMIIQYMSQKGFKTKYSAVRFGNVLGSNGSVIPLFNEQILNGGPVTVTHPDIIRYFMTIPEAVSLVLRAGSMAKTNEIFVLDMGKPVKIVDLAKKLIRLSGYIPGINMEIKYTGLRPGEKLYEELLMSEEGLEETVHDKIFIGKQIEVEPEVFDKQLEKLQAAANANNKNAVIKNVSEIVTTYKYDKNSVEKINQLKQKENKKISDVSKDSNIKVDDKSLVWN